MKEPIKAIGLWVGFLVMGDLAILALYKLIQTVGGIFYPNGAPFLGCSGLDCTLFGPWLMALVSLAATFNLVMSFILVILLAGLIGSAIASLIQTMRRLFAEQQ
jgi:hypothetical protein